MSHDGMSHDGMSQNGIGDGHGILQEAAEHRWGHLRQSLPLSTQNKRSAEPWLKLDVTFLVARIEDGEGKGEGRGGGRRGDTGC